MAFCLNCGNQVDGRFCAKCGTAVAEAASAGAGVPGAVATPPPVPTVTGATPAGLTDNVASALCYAVGLITGILFLVLAPYNQNRKIRFHAFQSIFLHAAVIVVWIGMLFVSAISGGLLLFVMPLIWLGFFVLWLVLIIKAYQDQKLVLPIIGPLAEKQA
jgi:uncharacterized membrane protein